MSARSTHRPQGGVGAPTQRSWSHDPFGLFGAPGPVTPAVLTAILPVPVTGSVDHRIPVSAAGVMTTWNPSRCRAGRTGRHPTLRRR